MDGCVRDFDALRAKLGATRHDFWFQTNLDYYNRIVESGYGIPRFARYDTLQNRFRAMEASPTLQAPKVMKSNPFREEQVAEPLEAYAAPAIPPPSAFSDAEVSRPVTEFTAWRDKSSYSTCGSG